MRSIRLVRTVPVRRRDGEGPIDLNDDRPRLGARGDQFFRYESSREVRSDRLEHPLVACQRGPRTDTPALRGEGRAPTTANTAAHLDLEIGEPDAGPPRPPNCAESEERVERGVCVHTHITLQAF